MIDFQWPESDLRSICRTWLGPRAVALERLDVGGFSGSTLVRVREPGDADGFVLKSFPTGTTHAKIAWIHGLVQHLRADGVAEVAEVMAAPGGDTIAVDATGGSWELVRFVAGTASDAPTPSQARAAAGWLARAHRSAAALPLAPPRREVPVAVHRRIEHARRLLAAPWDGAPDAAPRDATPLQRAAGELRDRAGRIFEAAGGRAAVRRIAAMRPRPMAVQAVFRDIWSDHVIYDPLDPDRVAGVVDLHASAADTPATDLARLLGSWRREPGTRLVSRWHEAVAAYEAARPLREEERILVPWLHATGVVFGLDNWFRWSLAEGREFARPGRALGRMQRLLEQVPECLGELEAEGPFEV